MIAHFYRLVCKKNREIISYQSGEIRFFCLVHFAPSVAGFNAGFQRQFSLFKTNLARFQIEEIKNL